MTLTLTETRATIRTAMDYAHAAQAVQWARSKGARQADINIVLAEIEAEEAAWEAQYEADKKRVEAMMAARRNK